LREEQEIVFGPVDLEGMEAGAGGTQDIGDGFIADVEGLLGVGAGQMERVAEDAGIGFGGSGEAGEGDGLKAIGDTEPANDGVQAAIEIGQEVEIEARAQRVQGGGRVIEEGPGGGLLEVLVEIREECGEEGFLQGGVQQVIESAANEGLPPGAVVVGSGGAFRVLRWRQFFPRGPERLLELGGIDSEAVAGGDAGVGDPDGLREPDEGSGRVKEEAADHTGPLLEREAGGRTGKMKRAFAADQGITLRESLPLLPEYSCSAGVSAAISAGTLYLPMHFLQKEQPTSLRLPTIQGLVLQEARRVTEARARNHFISEEAQCGGG
jgi:hypothetical protein